jgi:hypothetical protein
LAQGRVLLSTYEQLWLPVLNDLPDVEYQGRERFRAPYGTFEPVPASPFHGALWFRPIPGAETPAIPVWKFFDMKFPPNSKMGT